MHLDGGTFPGVIEVYLFESVDELADGRGIP